VRKNCNHFANALVWRLLGKTIPAYVNRLADIGVCCSYFLPKKLLEHAPVGDPTDGGSRAGGIIVSSKTKIVPVVFTGSGTKLGSTSGGGGLFTSLAGAQSSRTDDLTDRREKARMAAMARMERGNTESSHGDTDRSR
jgi:PPPDE putative peptidase domain